jgi:hypothetical protein
MEVFVFGEEEVGFRGLAYREGEGEIRWRRFGRKGAKELSNIVGASQMDGFFFLPPSLFSLFPPLLLPLSPNEGSEPWFLVTDQLCLWLDDSPFLPETLARIFVGGGTKKRSREMRRCNFCRVRPSFEMRMRFALGWLASVAFFVVAVGFFFCNAHRTFYLF